MDSTVLDDALRYLEMGISVIPLAPQSKKPPKGFRWSRYRKRRATEEDARTWFDLSDFNIGIVCGSISAGLTVRDFDDPEVYDEWAREHPDLAASLPTAKTGRCRHVYFKSGFQGIKNVRGGEIRGEAAYVVAPPSIHPSGSRYEWLIPLTELPVVDVSRMTLCAGQVKEVAHMTCVCCVLPGSSPTLTIEGIIQATLPTGAGQRNRKLFDLARHLKPLIPEAAREDLRVIVQAWHKLALPVIRTKPFDETWTDFVHAWQEVKRPSGPRWNDAVTLAERLDFPEAALQYDTDKYRELVRLCFALHQIHGGAQFALGCRKAAQYLSVAHRTASEMIKTLRFDRVLVLMNDEMQSGVKAFEYRYLGNGPGPLGIAPKGSPIGGVPIGSIVRQMLADRGIDGSGLGRRA